ncbi:MAG: nucleotide exchange factor GrpE [Bacilli bacterium]
MKKEKVEKVEENKINVDELNNKIKELENKVLLEKAELINYRKRKDEEVSNLLKYASSDIIMEIIGVMDNFERAIKLDDANLTDELSKFLDGFKMMYGTLNDILKRYGVSEIEALDQKFDHNLHNAIMTDNVDGLEDDIITEVLLKGYKLKERLLRPSIVKVNKKEIKNEKESA